MIEIYTAFAIIGLHRSVDMILWSFTGNGLSEYWDMMERVTFRNVLKPVIFCVYCMPSIWGTIAYLYFHSNYNVGSWAFFVLVVAAFVHLFDRVIDKLS